MVASFVLRALTPAGFMPELVSIADGGFKLVICTSMGAKTVSIDDMGDAPTGKQTASEQLCAFSIFAHAAAPVSDRLAIVWPSFELVEVSETEITRPPVRAGPVLGQRGPPLYA